MLNFHRECWNPVKKHSKALVFFANLKQIPIVFSADRDRAEKSGTLKIMEILQGESNRHKLNAKRNVHKIKFRHFPDFNDL